MGMLRQTTLRLVCLWPESVVISYSLELIPILPDLPVN